MSAAGAYLAIILFLSPTRPGTLITAGATVSDIFSATVTVEWTDDAGDTFTYGICDCPVEIVNDSPVSCNTAVIPSLQLKLGSVFVCTGERYHDPLADGLLVRWLISHDEGFSVLDVIQMRDGTGFNPTNGTIVTRP